MTEKLPSREFKMQQPSETTGNVFGNLAHSLTGLGASYELSRPFGKGSIHDEQRVGHIYFSADSGNIYRIGSISGEMADLNKSIRKGKVAGVALSDDSQTNGVLVVGEPFFYTGNGSSGNTSEIAQIVIVEDSQRMSRFPAMQMDTEQCDFQIVSKFEERFAQFSEENE